MTTTWDRVAPRDVEPKTDARRRSNPRIQCRSHENINAALRLGSRKCYITCARYEYVTARTRTTDTSPPRTFPRALRPAVRVAAMTTGGCEITTNG